MTRRAIRRDFAGPGGGYVFLPMRGRAANSTVEGADKTPR